MRRSADKFSLLAILSNLIISGTILAYVKDIEHRITTLEVRSDAQAEKSRNAHAEPKSK